MNARQLPVTDLYGITASEFSHGRSNPEVVTQMLDAGIKIVQYREKEFSMRQKYQECLAIRELCRRYQACFIVNDDVALAVAVEADGVHVGQDDLLVEKVRQIVGEEMIIGLSTHAPEHIDLAIQSGVVDYIGAGPIFSTATKKDVTAPVGLGYLDYAVKHWRKPLVAIGGIKLHNIGSLVRKGATCLALVTEIVGAADIGAMVRDLRAEISRNKSA